MKVKVRKIVAPYTDIPTKSLDAILDNHAHGKLPVRISVNQLLDITGVLADRKETAGRPIKTAEEAWAEFEEHYKPRKVKRHLRVDYLGEFDHCLVELSDVLPASCYAVDAIKKN